MQICAYMLKILGPRDRELELLSDSQIMLLSKIMITHNYNLCTIIFYTIEKVKYSPYK